MPACHDRYEPDEVAPASEHRPARGHPQPDPGECHDVYPRSTWEPDADAGGASPTAAR
jgi:hypothetical protein